MAHHLSWQISQDIQLVIKNNNNNDNNNNNNDDNDDYDNKTLSSNVQRKK